MLGEAQWAVLAAPLAPPEAARVRAPLRGDTTNRRAGCGRSARPVRREGDRTQSVLPTPIELTVAKATTTRSLERQMAESLSRYDAVASSGFGFF